MLSSLKNFLKKELSSKKPVLLGYSGGVDSQVLFELLVKCKQSLDLNLHVIHIDHRWRKESSEQALILKERVSSLGIPFHFEIIDDLSPGGSSNLEELYRERRIQIFQNIYKKIEAQALILGHQKNDQAETVFKRIFEGASLTKLVGLRQVSELKGMVVWRPMLSFSKKQLYDFLEKEGSSFIEDETNKDTHYLRARQREEIFPVIENKFGKNSLENLCKLAERMRGFEFYLDSKVAFYKQRLVEGPFGCYIDLNEIESFEDFEFEYFVRKVCEEYEERISYEAINTLIFKIKEKIADKKIILRNLNLHIDRGVLFFVRRHPPQFFQKKIFFESLPIIFQSQDFVWKIEKIEIIKEADSWREFWLGKRDFMILKEECFVQVASGDTKIGSSFLKDLYSEEKVPTFLRAWAPLIIQQENVKCNPWIKNKERLKEGQGVRLTCLAKSTYKNDFYSLKSEPLISSVC